MTALERLRSAKLESLGEVGIRTKLLELAAEYDDVILMGRGDPDLDTPDHIKEAAKNAIDNNLTHYSAVRGTLELRQAIADKLKRDNNLNYNPENEIMVTCGAEEAMFMAIFACINPGDEVIVPAPRYTSYDEAIKMWGGVTVPIEPKAEEDFDFLPHRIEEKITPKTKVISLVNPGNPIGFIGPDEVRAIAELAKKHDLIVISDEIYENIIFTDTPHLSTASIEGMRERTITINGPSKSYAMTGWRCGFLAAAAPLCEMLTEPTHTVSICTPAVTQAAALAAYTGPQDCVAEMRSIYNERREFMMGILDEMGLGYVPPKAGFYLYTDVSPTGLTPSEFCMQLLQKEHVLIFPGKLFADPTDRYVRISLLAPLEKIKAASVRMKNFVKSL